MTINPALPQWVYAVFAALGIVGGVLGLIGLFMGLTANGVAGFTYMCLGLVCGGMTFALKQHFEGEVERTMTELRSELRELELRLVETRDAMKRVAPVVSKLQDDRSEESPGPQVDSSVQALVEAIARQNNEDDGENVSAQIVSQVSQTESESTADKLTADDDALDEERSSVQIIDNEHVQQTDEMSAKERVLKPTPSRLSEADLVRQCLDRLQSLEKMVRIERWVETTRQELIDMRSRLKDLQRDFGVARQNWGQHLVDQGLEETVSIDAALEQRDQVARAALVLERITGLKSDSHKSRCLAESLRKRIEELGRRLEQRDADFSDPVAVLAAWEVALVESTSAREEQIRLRRAAKVCRRDVSRFRLRVRELNAKRSAILVRGGAISRDEFAERAIQLESRFEIQEKVDRAREELSDVASSERSMAIVESDLEAYDEEHNLKCIETIKSELDDLALDVESAFDELARIKQEVEELENDRSVAELRFDREQVMAELTELAEQWFALEWSMAILDDLRVEFEKNHQPPILARAKDYLQRLSGGRYANIWTPLGQQTLCVDDRDGNTLIVENLSGGTREQLFLAIRFALIEHYSDAGVELPIILDDVLVNFDHDRTQAAVDVLLQQTGKNQQILFFTCHQHLAEIFRQRGVSTVTLPTRVTTSSEHNDDLLAG
jgi:hypothetical protein